MPFSYSYSLRTEGGAKPRHQQRARSYGKSDEEDEKMPSSVWDTTSNEVSARIDELTFDPLEVAGPFVKPSYVPCNLSYHVLSFGQARFGMLRSSVVPSTCQLL